MFVFSEILSNLNKKKLLFSIFNVVLASLLFPNSIDTNSRVGCYYDYNNAHLGNTPAHEVGHNFGLNHLSHNSHRLLCDYENQNCSSTTGDLIADTPISTLPFFSLVTQNCELRTDGASTTQLCTDGIRLKMNKFDILFSAKNIMRAATEDGCRIGFTAMQHIQMNQMAINIGVGNE